MNKRFLLRAACWLFLLAPFAVSSTPPEPPPGRGFSFEGSIARDGGGSLANFVVVPMGWNSSRDDERLRFGCALEDYFPNQTHTLTDSNGRFFLTFWTCEAPGTLAVAVLTPDTLIVGSVVPMDELRKGYEVIGGVYEEHDGGGCDDGVTTQSRIQGYIFSADSLIVRVPQDAIAKTP